jgi:hypothetical protein
MGKNWDERATVRPREICTRYCHKDDRRSSISYCMLRIQASILILGLIAAPFASLRGTPSGTASQCPPLCPMMHDGTHTTTEQTDEMECHRGKSTKKDCLMKSDCGQALDLGLASPVPPAILCPLITRASAVATETIRLTGTILSLTGFTVPPFRPPRA